MAILAIDVPKPFFPGWEAARFLKSRGHQMTPKQFHRFGDFGGDALPVAFIDRYDRTEVVICADWKIRSAVKGDFTNEYWLTPKTTIEALLAVAGQLN
jgi:hypothetical protein